MSEELKRIKEKWEGPGRYSAEVVRAAILEAKNLSTAFQGLGRKENPDWQHHHI
jgi:hypothetical protein